MSIKSSDAASVSLSVRRAMQVLAAFDDGCPELGITDLSRMLSMSKTSIQRVVNALVEFSLLEQNRVSRKYRIGVGSLHVAASFLRNRSVEAEARQAMRELVDEVKHTCQFAVLNDKEMIITMSIEGPAPIRYSVPVGFSLPIHASASGKAVLSTFDDSAVEAILTRAGMERKTKGTVKSVGEFKDILRLVRQRGYAVNWEENRIGVGSVAAPISGCDFHSAIGVAFPVSFVRRNDIQRIGSKVLACARAISRRLAGLPTPVAA